MKRYLILAVAGIIVLGYAAAGVHYIVTREHKVQLQGVQLKSKTSDLKQLQLKYDLLNSNLDKELQKKNTDAEQLKKLESEKQDLEKQKQDLESQLQAKLDAKNAEANRIAAAAKRAENAVTGTSTAYAASGNADKAFIYQHESGNNPGAINAASGACGLGQALPCSKLPCSLSDYACQDAWFTNYAMQRYGSWANARAFWESHRWW